jgi:hypothetical protein
MPSKRRPDPFLPPGSEEAGLELAGPPRPVAPSLEITPPPVTMPQRRRTLEYKRPGTSWVTFVILGFAAVGMAAVGGTAIRKLMGHGVPTAPEQAQKAIAYSALSRDDAVLITVQVTPRDARLLLDADSTVSNPLRLLRSKSPHRLAASAPGYEGAVQEFVPDASKVLRLTLKKQHP